MNVVTIPDSVITKIVEAEIGIPQQDRANKILAFDGLSQLELT